MLRADFYFELPEALIAQEPLPERPASRLLCLDGASGTRRDLFFYDLPGLLKSGDLLVFNNTRVMPARLRGHKNTGGKVDVLVSRLLGKDRALAQIRASKSPKKGQFLSLGPLNVEVLGRKGEFFELRFDTSRTVIEELDDYGSVPLPPYINRLPDEQDGQRYQTVFAHELGAVAAPTAGLHFDEPLLARLRERGIDTAFITLHVGAGTFQPVRVERVQDHRMHSEVVHVDDAVCSKIHAVRAKGGRVIAVGTTVVRSLESALVAGEVAPFCGETDIFIRPGYRFTAIDGLITNFHLPESTLLMLVCAFGGFQTVINAYQHAIAYCYRFFSYGDAMLVWPQAQALTRSPVGHLPHAV